MSRPALKVGITGATGVLGQEVHDHLGQADGIAAVALVRPGRTADFPSALPLDATNLEACIAAVAECDLVVSAAGPAASVQPNMAHACRQTGTALLDLSGCIVDIETKDLQAPMVFACGVMPGWSELLAAMIARYLEPPIFIDVHFTPGGPLGPAGQADFRNVLQTARDRFGKIWSNGTVQDAKQTTGASPFLSDEAETFCRSHGINTYSCSTMRPNPLDTAISRRVRLEIGASGQDRRLEISTCADSAAHYSVAAVNYCLAMFEQDRLPINAVSFGQLPVSQAGVLAAFTTAGVGIDGVVGTDSTTGAMAFETGEI
ncbi:MAG: hypothetical protein QNJ09_13700 [Paracoccaceae bacterium]|nr:hypothetical protein [Paracoccaceae bacterium]